MFKSNDAFVSEVTKVYQHPNADKLDIAVVKGYRCIVPKGSLCAGASVLYVAPDAKLDTNKEWLSDYSKYLANGGRVRTIKLRGEFSEGLIIPLDKLPENINDMTPSELGITHWETLQTGTSMDALGVLPFGLTKTDQTNVQQMELSDILGKKYLVTRKMDGSSCTYIETYNENTGVIDDIHITSRTLDLKLDSKNIYTVAIQDVQADWNKRRTAFVTSNGHGFDEAVKKAFGCARLICRGEVCGEGINSSKVNKDCFGFPKFHLFEMICRFDDGTELRPNYHSVAFENWCSVFNPVPSVEIIRGLTEEDIEKYLNAPANEGEGVVLWELSEDENFMTGFSFKIKSKDYYSKI